MSRRKQARPIRHLESDADVDDRLTSVATAVVTDEEPVAESSASEEEEVTHPDDLLDEQNNNTSPDEAETPRAAPAAFPFPLPGHHVTLEALQNTKVAVAQFAATAMAGNADNAAALQELAVLQSTLFTLQHQQVMQLSLIQQLQQQLQITRCPKDTASPPPQPADSESPQPPPPPPTTQSLPASPPAAAVAKQQLKPPSPPPPLPPPPPPPPPPQQQQQQLPLCSISSSLASSIITNTDPPPLNEPNTLEMLQRRAQEVLDNASQGLLANNLADELAFRKGGKSSSLSPYDGKTGGRNEPFFKHRCRYCGKVFGSDSALQIHIRSHTGERPFKCNVCGSRFTTKGNLKVHFQRHTAKFPHIKMNPNPVPEHLDKYHPPLLAQLGPHQSMSPGMPPHPPPQAQPPSHHHPFHAAGFPPPSLYRPPHHELLPPPPQHHLAPPLLPPPPPHALFGTVTRNEQDAPENLSKPIMQLSPSPPRQDNEIFPKEEEMPPPSREDDDCDGRLSPKREPEEHDDVDLGRFPSPPPYDDCSLDSKYSQEDDSFQDQPENLSSKATSASQRLSPPSSTSSGSVDPAKDPAIYTSLLPRPGSNDNSWESLIEVTKTSETSKLQQLVDNIEHKLTDPNQCVICHRVLSCKSALQMHYRTHTGERPFKCKICGRAFTTKGNLKTHMGVHRAKPPARVLHQCPVCHKKFTNALVLQQHIRLHTGEPTELTPEQIQAAEVKDFPPTFPLPGSPFLQSFPPLPPPGIHLGFKHEVKEEKPDYGDEDNTNSSGEGGGGVGVGGGANANGHLQNQLLPPLPPPPPNFCTSLAALENQVRTITTMASQLTPSSSEEMKSPHIMQSGGPQLNGERSPSPSPQPESPAPSESGSLGALDLTPRANPAGVFSGFGLLPPGSSPLITSALTSSVLTSTAFSPIGLTSDSESNGRSRFPFHPLAPPHRDKLPYTFLDSNINMRPGNTTCNICFKTFACNSALEIHYRSHTKERPFKCTVCDRGFSTKDNTDDQGNHDCICDLLGQWRIQRDNSGGGPINKPKAQTKRNDPSKKKRSGKKYTARLPPLLYNPGYAADWHPFLGNMKQHMLTHKIRDMPAHLFETNKPTMPPPVPGINVPNEDSTSTEDRSMPTPTSLEPAPKPDLGVKRSPPEGETVLPIPKRQPGLPKHLCHVCNKNFSSSSALQIHMRTHTGDKPFRCTICQKAFTTKGNLKVHMGTHMWSNGASRRGRRMSLDLPPIPMTPKDSEFLQRRPDLFYPYLPTPFLNGMQQKLNEISVIQSVNSNSGLSPPGGKYASLLGFGGYPTDKPLLPDPTRSQPGSPLSDKQPSSVSPPPPLSMSSHHGSPPRLGGDISLSERSMWDIHYERKPSMGNGDEPMDVSPSPPSHVNPHQQTAPRGEGLAA